MASTDATPLPIRNQALRITFGLWLTTGLINSGAGGLDSEVSIDGGTFADCTNEATEIASGSGTYYLDLTSGEMNGDTIAIQVKSSTTNAITYKITIYPSSAGKMLVAVQTIGGQSVSAAGAITFPGTIASTTNITAAAGITVATNNDKAGYSLSNGSIATATFAAGATLPRVTLVDTTSALTGYVAPDNTSIGAIKTKTDFLPSATAGSAGGVFISGTNSSLTISGNVTVGGGLSIATTVAIGSTLTVIGTTTFGGAINITGNLHCVSNFNIDGALNIGGVSNISQTGDSYARIGATGSGLTSLAPSATALSSAVWTPTIAGFLDVAISSRASAVNLATANASLVKIQAATYDSATLSGSTLTLSNSATMVVSSTGRVTT